MKRTRKRTRATCPRPIKSGSEPSRDATLQHRASTSDITSAGRNTDCYQYNNAYHPPYKICKTNKKNNISSTHTSPCRIVPECNKTRTALVIDHRPPPTSDVRRYGPLAVIGPNVVEDNGVGSVPVCSAPIPKLTAWLDCTPLSPGV